MNIIKTLSPPEKPLAVALGCFDGVHIGHQKVIKGALSDSGLSPAVFTFEENPEQGASTVKNAPMLMTAEHKCRVLQKMGIETVYLIPFIDVKNISPSDFVRNVLIRTCKAKKICCGFNFRFGKGGEGTTELMHKICEEEKVALSVTEPVLVDGIPVSSTIIRSCVQNGEVHRAAKLLGRPFGFDFEVVHGRQLGRKLGTPTINQPFPKGFVLPKFGAYASLVHANGHRFYGVTNIGVKPTVGSDTVLAETWIPQFSGDLYGKCVQVDLLEFVRPEKKFASIEELQKEILKNGHTAKEIALNHGKNLK